MLIARNRTGAHIDAVLPDRSEAAVRPVLEGKLSKDDTLLCMDGDKALIAFAEAEGIEYELIIASKGEHVHEKVLHIQNVNAYGGRFKQWLNRFNGVATKYLPSYLDLPRFRGEARCWVSVGDGRSGLRPPCRCSSLVRPQRSPFLHPGPCTGSAVARSLCQARAFCAPARACA